MRCRKIDGQRVLTRVILPSFVLIAGCSKEGLQPGDNDYAVVQGALIAAQPGSTITLGEGRFQFQQGLSMTVDNVVIRGQGSDKTILSFANQANDSQGLLVKSDNFLLQDLAVEDSAGNAIKVEGGYGVTGKGGNGVTFRRVRVEWTRGPNTSNGAYGLYPVQCQQVLIEDSIVKGASDAGVYVGQSKDIIVRRNDVENNVAGIEIENSVNADVYDNLATHNVAGIAAFSLPGLQVKGEKGVRIFNNRMLENNTDNFAAKGDIVSTVPSGVGGFIMASHSVEFFNNTIQDNQTASLGIISYLLTGNPFTDTMYDPYPDSIYVHDNNFSGGGNMPDLNNPLGVALTTFLKLPVPDVIYDGYVDPMKLVSGSLPADLKICIRNNKHDGAASTFANVDGQGLIQTPPNPKPSFDATPYDCSHPALAPVNLPGASG